MKRDKTLEQEREHLIKSDPRREESVPPSPNAEGAEEGAEEGERDRAVLDFPGGTPVVQANGGTGLQPEEGCSDGGPAEAGLAEPLLLDEGASQAARRGEGSSDVAGSEGDPSRRSTPKVVMNQDPRLAEIEPLLATSDWDGILKFLGPTEGAGRLPPNLGLVYAIAAKERGRDLTQVNELAIRCAAGLVGVDPSSTMALLLAKRLLRKNPVGWQKKPAPRPLISILIVVMGLAVGCLIGYLVSFGYVRFHF